MPRSVHCIKLDKEAEGLDFAPYPGELGQRIFASVSKEAWQQWLGLQTMLLNEQALLGSRYVTRTEITQALELVAGGDIQGSCPNRESTGLAEPGVSWVDEDL